MTLRKFNMLWEKYKFYFEKNSTYREMEKAQAEEDEWL